MGGQGTRSMRTSASWLHGHRQIVLYSLVMALLVFALKWLQWKYLIADHSLDIYIGLIAALFTALGVWVANQLMDRRVKTVVVEKVVIVKEEIEHTTDAVELQKLGLTTRELEVLPLIAEGFSNAEIAGRLFLSLSTVKTHVSNLLVKLGVKNRTQAAEMAKRLGVKR
jgi:NarL family two-component system response regulator LiaR